MNILSFLIKSIIHFLRRLGGLNFLLTVCLLIELPVIYFLYCEWRYEYRYSNAFHLEVKEEPTPITSKNSELWYYDYKFCVAATNLYATDSYSCAPDLYHLADYTSDTFGMLACRKTEYYADLNNYSPLRSDTVIPLGATANITYYLDTGTQDSVAGQQATLYYNAIPHTSIENKITIHFSE